ncbi:MAG: hypothetical protein H6712_13240 [Myxococcales bacterium]|nr:hypothetical protein [Myxococcales bacterium]MCB9714825.1 hypothetical protein [Myxococcales bacterium]
MTSSPSSSSGLASPEELEQRAKTLLSIVRRQARRPYVVELAGTPKAGKTSALHVLKSFFKECGYQVQLMRERASDCPIAMKGHFFFNTWTTTTMIASMLENLDTEADILLLDRGVFDSIVWLEDQSRAGQVTPEERKIFRDFALLDRWRSLTDLTCVLTVTPEVAMQRENASLLVPRSGSIVSGKFLSRYNSVLATVREDVDDLFNFVDIDTSEHEPRHVHHHLASALIERMHHWVDPEIAAIPRATAEALFGDQPVLDLASSIGAIQREVVSRPRSVLERDEGFVQLVAAAVLRNDGKVLLVRRSAEDDEKRVTFGRDLLWKGCHVPRPDASGTDVVAMASSALEERLKEDFYLARLDSELRPWVLVWSRNPREVRHLGIVFDLEIPNAELARSLTGKVFKRDRNRTRIKLQELVRPTELHARMASAGGELQLESWSRDLLDHEVRRGGGVSQ